LESTANRKLLLTSVCQPFGEEHGDGFGVSYEGSHQIMWAQGIFRTRGTTTQWGIDFIAENLQIPTTTLHYPTMRRFISEIKKGYDYVGIAFVSPTLHKMIPMVQAIRQHAPATKIILGGYGTALGDEQLGPYADHICHGEGVAFMRRLLGERVDAPIVQPDITQTQRMFGMPLLSRTGYVFAGLGCPNGCDFCATSYYFDRKHIMILPDGPAILRAIQQIRARHPDITTIWINDEDFLLNETRGRSFLEAIRQSSLPPLSLSVFSSVKALSKYKASELVEMGIDWIWVGFEAKRAGYAKMQGRPYPELFADLRAHGISIMASMIIGFDYQTPETIEEEFEELIALRPSMSQFLIYGPAHGTPSHARLQAEGRLNNMLLSEHHLHDGFSLGFEHPHIGAEQMSAIQRGLYREEFRRLGPSVFRVAEDYLEGHVALRDHPATRVRAKAARYGQDAHCAAKVIRAAKRYLSPDLYPWLEGLRDRLLHEVGPLTPKDRVIERLAPVILAREHFKLHHDVGLQPEFTRRSYRTGSPKLSVRALIDAAASLIPGPLLVPPQGR